MHFAVKRELPILQPLDQVCFPERAAAVEQCRVQARHQREQLAVTGLDHLRQALARDEYDDVPSTKGVLS